METRRRVKLELVLSRWLLGWTSGAAFSFNYHAATDSDEGVAGRGRMVILRLN